MLLWLILMVGLGIRIALYLTLADTAYFQIPRIAQGTDMFHYWEWARQLAERGDWWQYDTYHPEHHDGSISAETWHQRFGGAAIFHWEPVYPYALGLLRLLGWDLPHIILLQLLLGAMAPMAVFLLTRHFFQDRIALLATAMIAFYGPLIANQSQLLRDWLQPMFEPWILLGILWAASGASHRFRSARWLAGGMPMGLSVLSKSTSMLLVPLMFGWIVWHHRRERPWRWKAPFLWCLGLTLAMSPLLLRNALVGAPLCAITNRVNINLICGNAADASCVGYYEPPSMGSILDQAKGSTLKTIGLILQSHQGHWQQIPMLLSYKFRALMDGFEVPSNLSYYYLMELSPVLHFMPNWNWLVPPAMVGFIMIGWPQRKEHALLWAWGLAILAGLMVNLFVARFRLPLVPWLAIYAAAAMVLACQALQERHWKWLSKAGLVILCTVVLQQVILPLPQVRNSPLSAVHPLEYIESAKWYAMHVDYERSLMELEKLNVHTRRNPERFLPAALQSRRLETLVRLDYARRLAEQGLPEEARQQIRTTEKLLALLHRVEPDADMDLYLAQTWSWLGDQAAAQRALATFVERYPLDPRTPQVKAMLHQP